MPLPPRFVRFARLIKLEHTLFALPFSLASMLLAAGGWPGWRTVGLILAAIVCGRSFAMALNRVVDRVIDGKNPRTRDRELPSGRLKLLEVFLFMGVALAGLIAATSRLPPLCMKLLPVAMLFLVSYSYTKYWTWLCHFVLGTTLAIPVLGSRIAVTGEWDSRSIALGLAVLAWVSGFDILYACQDLEFDRKEGLHSVPARFGVEASLKLTGRLHSLVPLLLGAYGALLGVHPVYYLGILLIAAVLVWELSLLAGGRLDRIGIAFFQANVIVSFVYLATCALAVSF